MAKKKMKKEMKMEVSPANDEKWKAEGDFRTLKEAEIIKADAKRMKKALEVGKEESKAIESLEELKEMYNKKYGSEAEMEEEEDGE